jgi:hypothetical protein
VRHRHGDRPVEFHERVVARLAPELFSARERGESAADEQLIPPRAVLVEQQDRLARRADTRAQTRRLNLHQGHESVNLRLCGGELREDAAEAQPLLAERGSDPVFARRRGVSLVEN